MENSNSNLNKAGLVIGSLLIGATIGGILGVLLAPDKGSVTRKKIVGKTNDIKNSIHDKFNDLMADAKEEFEQVKSKSEEFVEREAKG